MELAEIQDQLRSQNIDGWLLFDHHVRDPIAYRVLSLPAPRHVSRRWFYWIPAKGSPRKLVHRIEDWMLDAVPGDRLVYSSWRELQEKLGRVLDEAQSVAMQYSPNCMIPVISLADAGTVDLIRSFGKHVVSSAALVQYFEARWSEEQLRMHREAGRLIDEIRREAFEEIGRRVGKEGSVQEIAIADFIRERFAGENLVTEDGPIVAVNANSGNPHYAPTSDRTSAIRPGDFVLIDLWAKLDLPKAVYYDITWTGYVGAPPPSKFREVFEVVREARDRALELVRSAAAESRTVFGYAVDDAARSHIRKKGFGDYFAHRTGHSIGEEVHGNGANMDNLETRDERPVIPRTCFSIEPGIYLPEFGVRSELNCYVSETEAGPTGEVQQEIVRIPT